MQNIEFPESIVDVQNLVCFRFIYDDGSSSFHTLRSTDDFLNEVVPIGKSIAVILPNKLLKQRDEISQNIAYTKSETIRLKGLLNEVDAKLVEIRNERHNPQPSIFD